MASRVTLVLVLSVTIAAKLAYGSDSTTVRTGNFQFGQCHVEGHYPQDIESFNSLDTTRTHRLGSTWTERCRNCSCSALGAWCTGPPCSMPYDFTQENWCLQWSEDECCCEEIGCLVNGETFALGAEYPYGDGNPCLTCTCEIGMTKENCLRQKCGTYDVICEDGEVTYDDDCCPHFTCPFGATCTKVPDPFPLTPEHELENWFGGEIEPILVGMTQHYHIDSWNTYVCTCARGGTAECKMETYGSW